MIPSQTLPMKDGETISTLGVGLEIIVQDLTNQCVSSLNKFLLQQVIKKLDDEKKEIGATLQKIEMTLKQTQQG